MQYRHEVVAVDRLQKNPWNPNVVDATAEKKLDASIKRLGVFKPIIVREKDGKFEILGGQHRWEAAVRLGEATVPIVNLGKVDDTMAKEIGLADNGRWGHDDSGLLAEVYKALDVGDLTEFLPLTDAEIESTFATADIDIEHLLEDDDDDIDLEAEAKTASPPTHTIMRFKIPVLDAEDISVKLKQVMQEQGFTESDALTNAGDALVHLLGEHL